MVSTVFDLLYLNHCIWIIVFDLLYLTFDLITLAYWVIFHAFVVICCFFLFIFFQINFSEKFFQELHFTTRLSNSLNPDQAGCFVGPDLGPNCLRSLSADNTSIGKELLCKVKPVLSGHLKIDKTKVLMENGSSMKVEPIAECSPWSILQYFWPALSDNWYGKPIFGVLFEWPLKTGLAVFEPALKILVIYHIVQQQRHRWAYTCLDSPEPSLLAYTEFGCYCIRRLNKILDLSVFPVCYSDKPFVNSSPEN